jgi:predicted transcriptional regulator
MPRLTISVSDELKSDLDAVGEQFNISAVCQRALAAEVAYRKSLHGKGKATLAKRLEGERGTIEEHQQALGRRHGAGWAQTRGGFESLETLRQLEAKWDDRYLADEDFCHAVRTWGEDYGLDDYWSEVTVAQEHYIEGFVEGVLDAYGEALDGGSE